MTETRKKRESILMTVNEVAEFFGVEPLTVREWCRVGKLEAVRPGRAWKIKRKAVYALAQVKYGEAGEPE
jgi:excisionase family DNA binding protein